MLTIRGILNGSPAEVIYRNGLLTGDAALRKAIADRIESGELVHATPVGPSFDPGLKPAWRAYVTILNVLDQGEPRVIEGDVPTIPNMAVPDGAVS